MPETDLDAAETYARLDPERLVERIAGLPDQLVEGWHAGVTLDLPASYRDVERVVVLGMGGSGIGGLLLRGLAQGIGSGTPVEVVRGYAVPAHVGKRTLALASSNSGNTEETVAALREARDRGAQCIAVTTGGGLLDLARASGIPVLTFEWQHEPRAALGWSFATLLGICSSLLLLDIDEPRFHEAVDEMHALETQLGRDAPEAFNPAKQLARRLSGKLPVIVGAEALAPVAYRWRTQVNENAKQWAFADELPEFNHNQHAGYGLPAAALPLLHTVILRHADVHRRISLRIDATLEEMRLNRVVGEVVEVSGSTVLAQMLRAVLLGDYVSFYLGVLNGVHPSPVPALGRLKDHLARQP
jgi:glucose/mannose-6-phosphate isomerase